MEEENTQCSRKLNIGGLLHRKSLPEDLIIEIHLRLPPLLENPSQPTEAVEFSMEHRLRVLGSCNGLVCLFDIDEGYVRLWNPSTKFESNKSTYLNLLFDKWSIAFYGFSYDHVNDKYKALVDVRLIGNIGYEN
ncbi:hypothetical protein RYX36_005099, partial [Vicia faba]